MKLRSMLGLFFLAGLAATPVEAQAPFQMYRPATDKTPIAGQPTFISNSNSQLQVDGKRIVFFGIDAMMPKQPCNVGPRIWDCGSAAQRILMNLVGREPVECHPQMLDRFRRVFAKCTVHGQDIAQALVEAGMAVALPEETTEYVASEARAKAEKKGIWEGNFLTPAEFREHQVGYPQAR